MIIVTKGIFRGRDELGKGTTTTDVGGHKIRRVRGILKEDMPVKEKDKKLAKYCLDRNIDMRKLKEYVKLMLIAEEISESDFEGSRLLRFRVEG